MSFSVKILADSVNPQGSRLTTYQLKYPRFVHSEMMTHRAFCLAGDSELEFDLPSGTRNSNRRVYKMRIDQFVDKWLNGANRLGSKQKTQVDLSWIEADKEYSSVEVSSRFGMASASNINVLCRNGIIEAHRSSQGKAWMIKGSSLISWRNSKPDENRYDIKNRLSSMKIRQLNEDTGDIQWSRVVNAIESGEKEVFEVQAGDYRVAGSADHLIKTATGWKKIQELTDQDFIVVRKFGKPDEEKLDPLRLKKIDGLWRSKWQNEIRSKMSSHDSMCRKCKENLGTDIHHIIPVHEEPSLAFQENNATLLCQKCHFEMHQKQGWQNSQRLYGSLAKVNKIVSRGIEKTYDLEIAGKYPNFLANGVIVHNSRNASSSRAIPIEKMIQWVEEDPAMPIYWGSKKKGMQAGAEIEHKWIAETLWKLGLTGAIGTAKALNALGLHKQIVNRILEPWAHMNVVLSATEFDNFFTLRAHKDAQPELQNLAVEMAVARRDNSPTRLEEGQWHLPYITSEERNSINPDILTKVSVARCCRVSYLTVDGKPSTIEKDLELHDMLLADKHMSPFEHVAYSTNDLSWNNGNFCGFHQYRKLIPGECHQKFDYSTLDQFDRGYVVETTS